MARRNLTSEQEIELQAPIFQAIGTYFANAYTDDREQGSVGSMAIERDGYVIMYNAFRVPEVHAPKVRQFLEALAEAFEAQVPDETEQS